MKKRLLVVGVFCFLALLAFSLLAVAVTLSALPYNTNGSIKCYSSPDRYDSCYSYPACWMNGGSCGSASPVYDYDNIHDYECLDVNTWYEYPIKSCRWAKCVGDTLSYYRDCGTDGSCTYSVSTNCNLNDGVYLYPQCWLASGGLFVSGNSPCPAGTEPTLDGYLHDYGCVETGSSARCELLSNITASCGDGLITPPEVCDSSNLAGQTCASQGFSGGGTLRCGGACVGFDTSGCLGAPPPTVCIGDTFFYNWDCTDGSCAYDTNVSCNIYDGPYYNYPLCWISLGGTCPAGTVAPFDGLVHDYSCVKNESNPICKLINISSPCGCELLSITNRSCGDGYIISPEVCEGSNLAGQTCTSQGFSSGTLKCSTNCLSFDTSGCLAAPSCGNGLIAPPEVCDTTNLAGQTCTSQGYSSGTLKCSTNCLSFDTSGCFTPSISGFVRNASLSGVAGASVKVVGTVLSATTASDGSYRVSNVRSGTYDLVASKPSDGYEDGTLLGVQVLSGNVFVDFTLVRALGKCKDDCTTVESNLCDASCQGKGLCWFDSPETMAACDGTFGLIELSGGKFVDCCLGKTYLPIKALISVPSENVITLKSLVLYKGKFVNMVIVVFNKMFK